MHTQDTEIRKAISRNPHVTNCYTPFYVELPQNPEALAAAVCPRLSAVEAAEGGMGLQALAVGFLHAHALAPTVGAQANHTPRPYFF